MLDSKDMLLFKMRIMLMVDDEILVYTGIQLGHYLLDLDNLLSSQWFSRSQRNSAV